MDEGDVLRSGLEVPNTSYETEKKIKVTCKSQHLLEQQVHSWYVHATERADRSDKRDERGELETTICSGHILSPYPFVILRKKKLR